VLLGSVISELLPMDPPHLDLKQRLVGAVVRHLNFYISKAVEAAFLSAGIGKDLIYNGNFRTIAGGPKWLKADQPERACVRKYLGVRGMGDFTLVIAHPEKVLETDAVVHSHSHPRLWTELDRYRNFRKFASVRNPIGIVNSSLFSINALTSEYIQRYVDPRDDNHDLREHLALFKFTNLDFFSGIVRHYKHYFEEFLSVADRYHVMRWEDLIERPADTICRIAAHADLSIEPEHATEIWQRIDHVNLTGAHKHNYRHGKGIVGDWKNWMTNRHLEIMRAHGLEKTMLAFGYGPIEPLDETDYTAFQQQVAGMIARGEVYDRYADRDLFGFSFNKSNLDSSAFAFRRYEWRGNTCVERSGFTDEAVVMAVSDAAEAAADEFNRLLDCILTGDYSTDVKASASLAEFERAATPIERRMPRACAASRGEVQAILRQEFENNSAGIPIVDPNEPPRLIRGWKDYNIVSHLGRFSAIPRAAGPIDLRRSDPDTIDGALVRDSYVALFEALQRTAGH
jgi:Sulfotransferase domain